MVTSDDHVRPRACGLFGLPRAGEGMAAQLHRGHGKSSANCIFMFRTRRALFRKKLMSNMLCLLQDVAGHEAPLPPPPDKTKRIL